MYLPKPDAWQTEKDVDEVYTLSSKDLQQAPTAEKRRRAFRDALLRAYTAGVVAQHALALEKIPCRSGVCSCKNGSYCGPLVDTPGGDDRQ